MSEQTPQLDRSFLNDLVGTKVKSVDLYQRAFTHKSALKRYSGLTGSYETLEFMGDSVLGFIITKHLFDLYEEKQEGFLTKARTKMVRGTTLCEISKSLGLDKKVLMDEKGERNGWATNPNILEDVFEAFVGAIYLDLGMVHAKRFVLGVFSKANTSLDDDNYKDQLMRWCQVLKIPLPEYNVLSHTNGTFCIQLIVDGLDCGCGFASTKRQAEQNAANIVLKTDARFKNKEIPVNASKNRKPSECDVPRAEKPGVAGSP
jgi:ribonuclease-3